jgi:MFS family permease
MKELDFKLIFCALRHRNYRLFFSGQSISLVGTWMQKIAVSWLVYRMTNSVFMLGLVGFVGQIPTFVVAPFAGVIADRYSRQRLLLITQILSMVQAFVLSFLVLTHLITIWQLIVLSLFLGLVNSFDIPIRQSFTVEMIEEGGEDLGNAIALNSSMVNMAKLVGPSVAGILIAMVGEGMCFFINAVTYLAVIASLLAMNVRQRYREIKKTHIMQELKEGLSYVLKFEPIKHILILLGVVSLMGHPYLVLMPVFAKDILHGGPQSLGFLTASSGVGALTGALYLASRRTVRGLLGRIIARASNMFGFAIIAFSFSRILWLSMVLLLFAGFGMMVQMASSNTVLQTIVEESKRGRIMSFYAMAVMGMTPFGSLLAGTLASKIGAPNTLLVGGISCLAGAFIFTKKIPVLRQKIRPIYIKKGIILEEVAN